MGREGFETDEANLLLGALTRLRLSRQIAAISRVRNHQVEAAGPLTLVLEAAIAHFAQTVEEHGFSQPRKNTLNRRQFACIS